MYPSRELDFVARTVRLRSAASKAVTFLALGLALACGSSSGEPITPEPDPVLESIDYELLGAGKVAFQREGGIGLGGVFVIDASAKRTAYVRLDAFAFGPALSPDGQKLAFTKPVAATAHDVHVIGIDGSGERQLTSIQGQEGAPSWSPDGNRVIMLASSSGATTRDIFSQSPNGGDLKQLTNFLAVPGQPFACPMMDQVEQRASIRSDGTLTFGCLFGEIDVLASNGVLLASYKPSRADRQKWPTVLSPTWSPNGTEIAFVEFISDIDAGPRVLSFAIKVMSADGSKVTTLATFPIAAGSGVTTLGGYIGWNNKSICWMPDGLRLVFNVPETLIVGHLWVVRRDGSGLAQLTNAPGVWDRSVSCSRS